MRYMIIVLGTPEFDAGVPDFDSPVMAEMAHYHRELAAAGALLDGAGLRPTRDGWRIRYEADGTRTVTDGPFAELKEVVCGYTLIDVPNREAALEWTRRFPAPFTERPCRIEVRPLYEASDFERR